MSNSAKAPLLFIKLPRKVVEKLQSAPPNEAQLVLGGKERILHGSLIIGSSRHGVRYASERATLPPLLFQGGSPHTASSEGWASWTQCGKGMGRLTLDPKNKLSGSVGSSALPNVAKALKSSPTQPPDEALLSALHAQASSSAAKSPPQKKSGIVRHNRELLRDKVLHLLALAPADELELVERLKSPSSAVLDVLGVLAKKTDTMWTLLPEQYKHVQIESWSQYNAREREKVIDNALAAFDVLGLALDNPERRRVLQIQRRLENGSPPAQPTSVVTSSAASLKSSSVPSISLPKDVPTPKKKPVRSVIAPTLAKKLKMDSNKEVKRMSGGPASASGATTAASLETTTSNRGNSTHTAPVADSSARDPPRSAGRPARPVPTSAQKPNVGRPSDDASELQRAVPESTGSWNQTSKSTTEQWRQASVSSSVPVTAIAGSDNASSFRASPPRLEPDSSPHMPQNRLTAHGTQRRRPRGLSDSNNNTLHADSEYRRQQWAADASSPPASRHGRSRSRSNSRGLRAQRLDGLAATAAAESTLTDVDKVPQHVPVRSRPLKAQIHEIQAKLAHNIAEERAREINATIGERNAQSIVKDSRGVSLSPIEDLDRSCTPSPVMAIECVETLDDLSELEALLTTTYAEYSQLRLKIDNHCAECAPLLDELESARAAYTEAVGVALNERKSSEADREEGEEVPGDAPVTSALAMTIDPTTEKYAPDGSRLYWAETDAGAWLADSADADVDMCAGGGDQHPTRMRDLLPVEARVLRANQAIVDQYKELDSGDVRHWVRRYLRLHVQVEQMSLELTQAHARITNDILSQFDELRDVLGDDLVDDAIAEANDGTDDEGGDAAGRILTIGAYRDDIVTMSTDV
ncbi:hypothetical protein GGH94_004744 [Coemansia aciculifera]|uniref:RNA polymerase II elongation factor ELL N-terminal domain-containing protein n=1 Tax=Coemansia aciculifera TaxID=417176 RepID=A0A9W8IER2_9FUNG|nr:hypothetical protein GGH94_004744 [Coemansia aciculifera]